MSALDPVVILGSTKTGLINYLANLKGGDLLFVVPKARVVSFVIACLNQVVRTIRVWRGNRTVAFRM